MCEPNKQQKVKATNKIIKKQIEKEDFKACA